MLPVDDLLKPSGVGLLRLFIFKERASVTGRTGRRGLVFVGHGIATVRVEHGHPHGVVERAEVVPESRFRTADALVLDLHAEGLFIIKLTVTVVVSPGAFAVIPFHASMGGGAAGVDGLAVAEGRPSDAIEWRHLIVKQVTGDAGCQVHGMGRAAGDVDGVNA